jgi:hypothetical protein
MCCTNVFCVKKNYSCTQLHTPYHKKKHLTSNIKCRWNGLIFRFFENQMKAKNSWFQKYKVFINVFPQHFYGCIMAKTCVIKMTKCPGFKQLRFRFTSIKCWPPTLRFNVGDVVHNRHFPSLSVLVTIWSERIVPRWCRQNHAFRSWW